MKKLIVLLYAIFIILQLQGQDIHFSQFNQSYLNLNPAETGRFNGDYRFNGNFKNQWSSISEPFQTFSFSAEGKQLIDKLPKLATGLTFYHDQAGAGNLQTTEFQISLAYSNKITSDSSLSISGGLQLGVMSRSINFDRFTFDEQYNGRAFNPNQPSGENFALDSYNNFSLHSGLAFEYLLEDRKSFQLGFSFYNLSSPDQSFLGSNIPLDLRSSIYLTSDYIVSEKLDLLPGILHSRQGKFQETVIGSNLRYRLNESSYLKRNVYGGLWYRNADAIIISSGIDYNQWQVGLSYDINISGLEVASNNRGGLEIALTYIITNFNPLIRKYKVCPKYL